MLIYHDPDDFVVETKKHTCEYHKRMPWDVAWAGCTCSSSYSSRAATPKERAANIKAREKEETRRQKHMQDYYDAGKLVCEKVERYYREQDARAKAVPEGIEEVCRTIQRAVGDYTHSVPPHLRDSDALGGRIIRAVRGKPYDSQPAYYTESDLLKWLREAAERGWKCRDRGIDLANAIAREETLRAAPKSDKDYPGD